MVAVTVVRGDAAGVPQGGGGQVAHGVSIAREHVAPQELTFSQRLIKLSEQVLCDGCREGGGKACEGFVRARVVLGHDQLTRCVAVGAEVVNHDGDQVATHDAAGDKGGRGRSKGRAKVQTTAGDSVVACHQE